MRASIEKLARLVPMTELFTESDVRQKPDIGNTERPRFNDMLSETRERPRAGRVLSKREDTAEPEKTEEKEEKESGESTAAVLFGQNSVVFILEGEKEEDTQLQAEEADVTVTTGSVQTEVETKGTQESQLPIETGTTEESQKTQGVQEQEKTSAEEYETDEEFQKIPREMNVNPDTGNTRSETEPVSNTEREPDTKSATGIGQESETEPEVTTEQARESKSAEASRDTTYVNPDKQTENARTEGQTTETQAESRTADVQTTEAQTKSQTADVQTKGEATQSRTTHEQPEEQGITGVDVQAAAEENRAVQPQTDSRTAEYANQAQNSKEPDFGKMPEETEIINPVNTESGEETDADNTTDIDATGKTMARTPETKTTEQSNEKGQENNKDFSKSGGSSPLENENDKNPVEGKKTYKTYEMTDTVRDTEKTEQKPADGTAAQNITDFLTRDRFQSAQQIREIARPVQQTPVFKENLFEAMVERIDMMKTADTRQMSIQLNPEFLGEVTLNITMDAAGLHVKIGAGNREVSGMINAQINSLIETLSNKGIEVAKVEVAYSGVEHNNANTQQEQQQSQGQPGRSRRGTGGRRIESSPFYAVNALEEMSGYVDMGVSSVEYRA